MRRIFFLLTILAVLTAKGAVVDAGSQYKPYAPDGVPFCVAEKDWYPDSLGNHRAVIEVTDATKPVEVTLMWRRADVNPAAKRVDVVAVKTGRKLKNVATLTATAEKGVVCFDAAEGAGMYYVYYMPYRVRPGFDSGRGKKDWNDYFVPDKAKESAYLASIEGKGRGKATLVRYESRTNFEFFTSMGTIATEAETQRLLLHHPENPVIFTEDRGFPIRLTDHLPVRWIDRGAQDSFEGTAMRNEYYTWQIGVWSPRENLQNVHLAFSDLCSEDGMTVISSSDITCFNQEGTNWDGSPMRFDVNVPKGKIQALWCGVQIPEKAPAGTYKGTVTLTAKGTEARKIDVRIQVLDGFLADKGDGELWRHSRLRWLNSTLGADNHPVKPFSQMTVKGKRIQATEKTVELGSNGMIKSIKVNGCEVLSESMSFAVETDRGITLFDARNAVITQDADGLVTWTASAEKNGLGLSLKARMEYDGYLNYQVSVASLKEIKVKDVRLQMGYTSHASRYFMGIGCKGGYRPETIDWNWQGLYDSYWIGNTDAGLHVEFRGGDYCGPLLKDYRKTLPRSWYNAGKGHVKMTGREHASIVASSGEVTLTSEPILYEFAMNITPTKPVDVQKQLHMHFFHGKKHRLFEAAANDDGANVCNIHHATELNPVINYPFIVSDSLKAFIGHHHQYGRKIKLYYTLRELTNYTAEIYAIKSLGSEIIADGNGKGAPWLCEHLVDHFGQAWYTTLKHDSTIIDASFITSPFSRWINYYLEGLNWMMQNYGIDGIYMDDVSFDRTIMKRIRKIMMQNNADPCIDLHCAREYSNGPANQYTDFFPYVDRLWFGEEFPYNKMAHDEWLVAFSGIPFGPMSDMLENGQFDANPYLGALYGATTRHSYQQSRPGAVWRFWREYDLEDAEMVGYWERGRLAWSSDDEVKVTVYSLDGRAILAVGNFSDVRKVVCLGVDWKGLGMNPGKVRIRRPWIEGYQRGGSGGLNVVVEGKGGMYIVIDKEM